jgi:hypothetical protein
LQPTLPPRDFKETDFDLPAGVREDTALDPTRAASFVRDIIEVESYVNEVAVRNPGIAILVRRFFNNLNLQDSQLLARYLDPKVAPTVAATIPASSSRLFVDASAHRAHEINVIGRADG